MGVSWMIECKRDRPRNSIDDYVQQLCTRSPIRCNMENMGGVTYLFLSPDALHPRAYVHGGFYTAVEVSTQNEWSKLSALNASREVYMEVAWSHVRI